MNESYHEKRPGRARHLTAGARFGLLTTIDRAPNNAKREIVWDCRCDCGKAVRRKAYVLHEKSSCGCTNRPPPNCRGRTRRRAPVSAEVSIRRIMSRIEKPTDTGCWRWTGRVSQDGYAAMRIGKKNVRTHRLSYSLFVGPIPDGMMVCHRCDNPVCVNPAHLFVGTNLDNVRDRMSKGRGRGVSRKPRSSPGYVAKLASRSLTSEQAADIRRMSAEGRTQSSLARRFGVDHGTIGHIVRGETYVDAA